MFSSQVPDCIQVPFKIMEIIYNSDVIVFCMYMYCND